MAAATKSIELHPSGPPRKLSVPDGFKTTSITVGFDGDAIGVNAGHSFCLILFGAVYGYLSTRHRAFLFDSWFLLVLGFALLLSYVAIAKLYFFRAPFLGVGLATVFYLLGIVVNLV